MNFWGQIIIFFYALDISNDPSYSLILNEFPGFTSDEVLVVMWIHFTIFTMVYFSWNIISEAGLNFWTKKACSLTLYLFGVYRSLSSDILSSFKLVFKNLSLFIYFIKYNLLNLIDFLPRFQIWSPLFRRGGYLSFLNSSRTRWQLTKSNSLFKNK